MVFSGIIECRGEIVNVVESNSSGGRSFSIRPTMETFLEQDIFVGCSIAVDGVCLTVTDFDKHTFQVDLAPETLSRTHFFSAREGDCVNLENALRMSERNSGHTVQGHVDGVGKIMSVVEEGISLRVKISTHNLSRDVATRQYMNSLIVSKGFIAVDGASLTVCEVNRTEEWFTLMLIPHTQAVLKPWIPDGLVNIEIDCLAKYITANLEGYISQRLEIFEFRSQVSGAIAVVSLAISMMCLVKLLVRN